MSASNHRSSQRSLRLFLSPIAAVLQRRYWPYALGLLSPGLALAGPTDGNVVAGSAAISNPDATHTQITQSSQNAVINWGQFNVGSDEYVVFQQPNSSAAILNRVIGGDPSTILGNITANGRVFLVNPQGIIFGEGAKIDVGGIAASTLNISDDNFMAGRYQFVGNSTAAIRNHGSITASDKGFVVLAADAVSNSGLVKANLGQVVLASGSAVTLDFDGNGLINYQIDQAALSNKAGVDNVGEIAAEGGAVVMSAQTADDLTRTTVNNSGLVQAQGITTKGGAIYLTASGGSIANSGRLDASGKNGHNGGAVVARSNGNIRHSGSIDVSGKNGGTARLIADRDLTTTKDSVIDARATDATQGRGGFVELSGHQSFKLDGQTFIGQGGTLLIDPDHLIIKDGDAPASDADADTIYVNDIEGLLNNGANVFLVANHTITFSANESGDHTINAGEGGAALTIGLGTISDGTTSSASPFGETAPSNPTPFGFTLSGAALSFTRKQDGVDGDVINLVDSNDSLGNGSTALDIDITGDVDIETGKGHGSVVVGSIRAKSIAITAADDITMSEAYLGATDPINLTAENGDIGIFGSTVSTSGDLTLHAGNHIMVGITQHELTEQVSKTQGTYTDSQGNTPADSYGNPYTYDSNITTTSGYTSTGSALHGAKVTLTTDSGDITVVGSTITATGDLTLDAAHHLHSYSALNHTTTTTDTYGEYAVGEGAKHLTHSAFTVDTPIDSSLSGNQVTLSAGTGDVKLVGGSVSASGDLDITAAQNIEIANSETYTHLQSTQYLSDSSSTLDLYQHIPTPHIQAGGFAAVDGGGSETDTPPPSFHTLQGANITLTANAGNVSLHGVAVAATGDLNITAQKYLAVDASYQSLHVDSNTVGDTYGRTYVDMYAAPIGSELSGKNITLTSVAADGGIHIYGSRLIATADAPDGHIRLQAQGDVLIDRSSSYEYVSLPDYSDANGKPSYTRLSEPGQYYTINEDNIHVDDPLFFGAPSEITGTSVEIVSTSGDVAVYGSTVSASQALNIHAAGDIDIGSSYEAFDSTVTQSHTYDINLISGRSTEYNLVSGSTLNGDTVTLTTDSGDIRVSGSSITATGDLSVTSGGYLSVRASRSSYSYQYIDSEGYSSYYSGSSNLQGSTLHGGSVTLAAAQHISLQGTAIEATGDVNVTAGSYIDISSAGASSGSGPSYTYSYLDSHLLSDGDIHLTATHGQVRAQYVTVAGLADTAAGGLFIHATGVPTPTDEGGENSLTNLTVSSEPQGGIWVNHSDLTVDRLEAVTDNGSIDLYGTKTIVGTGEVDTGVDVSLLQRLSDKGNLPSGLTVSSKPNAVFSSTESVDLGHLTMTGNYLYVKAAARDVVPALNSEGYPELDDGGNPIYVSANFGGSNLDVRGKITYNGTTPLFYNAMPSVDSADIVLYAIPNDTTTPAQLNYLAPNYEVTLALGSSTFSGNISVINPGEALPASDVTTMLGIEDPNIDPPFNFAFVTGGNVTGTENITIPGNVFVLKNVTTAPPPSSAATEAQTVIGSTQQDNPTDDEKKKKHEVVQDGRVTDDDDTYVRIRHRSPLRDAKSCT